MIELRKIVKAYRRVLKKLLKNLRNQIKYKLSVRITTLNDLYGNSLDKIYPIPSETIPTEETRNFVFWPSHKQLKKNSYTTPEIYTTNLQNVIFHPDTGALFTQDKKIILDSLFEIRRNQKHYLIKIQEIIDQCNHIESIPGQCALYRTYGAYGHQLIDSMARLYLLNQKKYLKFVTIKLLYPKPLGSLEALYFSKMTMPNIYPHPVEKDTLYHIENLIFPSFMTKDGAMYLPKAFTDEMKEKILPQRIRSKNKKIYISREQQKENKGRAIINELELLKTLEKLGFKKYILENMSIEEKINLFYDAEIVISPEGSGLCHIVFSENIDVLVLSPSKIIGPHYYFLCKSPGLMHHLSYWYGNNSVFNANFHVDVSQVIDTLNQNFGYVARI